MDSLLQQTMPVDIVIVNDGSTDGTLQIAERFAFDHSNVKVISKENEGLPQARRAGLSHTDAAFIGFVDADDWVEPDMYERLYHKMQLTGTDIACCDFFYADESGNHPSEYRGYGSKEPVLSPEEALYELHMRRAVFPFLWNKLFRRKLFEGISFPKKNFIGEDYATTIQLINKAQKVFLYSLPFYHYWQEDGSMSKDGFGDKHYRSFRYFQHVDKEAYQKGHNYQRDVACYISVEYMSYLVAMDRNHVFDEQVKNILLHM